MPTVPQTLGELLNKLTTDFLFLGLVASLLTTGIITILEKYVWNDSGRLVPGNWRRALSLVVPVVLGLVAYGTNLWYTNTNFQVEGFYSFLVTVVFAEVGSKVTFTVTRAVKGSPDPPGLDEAQNP